MSKMVTIPDSGGLKIGVKLVNPAVAKRWLSQTQGKVQNRRPSPARIRKGVHSMKEGEWVLAEPIMFNCKGGLVDGQTRLLAVLASGLTIPFLVMEGLPPEVFSKINTGWERKLLHCLQIDKEANANILATVIIMAAKDEKGIIPTQSNRNFFLTSDEGLAFLKKNPSLRESVNSAPGTRNSYVPRATLCFCHWKFSQINKADANEFLIALVRGEVEGEGDPVYLLRERLKSNKRAKSGKMPRNEVLALIYKAWNANRKNEKLHNLRWRRGGPQAENFPVPI